MKLIEKIDEFLGDIITEAAQISGTQYTFVLLGGSLGDSPIRSLKDLKGKKVIEADGVYNSKEEAQEKVKRMNKLLSPGEKKFYRMKYTVAELKDGVYTGN